jgi:hypothetical protein
MENLQALNNGRAWPMLPHSISYNRGGVLDEGPDCRGGKSQEDFEGPDVFATLYQRITL